MGIKRKLIKIMKKYECPCCGQKRLEKSPITLFKSALNAIGLMMAYNFTIQIIGAALIKWR